MTDDPVGRSQIDRIADLNDYLVFRAAAQMVDDGMIHRMRGDRPYWGQGCFDPIKPNRVEWRLSTEKQD
jgi:hypothetical protein